MGILLIVEDNMPLGQLYAKFLAQFGRTVRHTTTCRQTIAFLEAESLPDLILLDMSLPDGEGLSILEHLQERRLLTQTRIIAMSSDEEYSTHVAAFGVKQFFAKPINLTLLTMSVRTMLQDKAQLQN